jgi:thiopeptide-type bacteriocin biosynthesis protein
MPPTTRLFVYLPAPRDTHEAILLEHLAPLVRDLGSHPDLESISFTRSSVPEWLLRLMVHGRSSWIEHSIRPLFDERLGAFSRKTIVDSEGLPEYRREIRRWGGETGIVLAERTFHHDTLACLDWMEAESRGEVTRSRRELSLLMTDRLLDLLRFGAAERLAFYKLGHAWPLERGLWKDEDLEALERRYQALRPGLLDLLGGRTASDPVTLWGGAASARIAESCLERLRPVAEAWIEARSAGRLDTDWQHLVWSLAHVHSIRLGVDSEPEAILRFFMYRYHQDGSSRPS